MKKKGRNKHNKKNSSEKEKKELMKQCAVTLYHRFGGTIATDINPYTHVKSYAVGWSIPSLSDVVNMLFTMILEDTNINNRLWISFSYSEQDGRILYCIHCRW